MNVLSEAIRSKLIESMHIKAKTSAEEELETLLEELSVQSSTRYRAIADSINRTEMYLTWMVDSGSPVICDERRVRLHKFLEIKLESGQKKAFEVSKLEKEIDELVRAHSFHIQKDQMLVKAFVHAKNGLLTLQKQVMQKESEVANFFIHFAREYIAKNFDAIKHDSQQNAYTLANAVNRIKKDSSTIQNIFTLNYEAILHSIDKLNDHLKKQNDKLIIINKAINYLSHTIIQPEEVDERIGDEPATMQSVQWCQLKTASSF
jgi:chromosome condensin MukBEF ATPase and DNA-binding subunit MukB